MHTSEQFSEEQSAGITVKSCLTAHVNITCFTSHMFFNRLHKNIYYSYTTSHNCWRQMAIAAENAAENEIFDGIFSLLMLNGDVIYINNKNINKRISIHSIQYFRFKITH
jgi:hypothetical protein